MKERERQSYVYAKMNTKLQDMREEGEKNRRLIVYVKMSR